MSNNAVPAEYDAIGQAGSAFEQNADQVGRMADHIANSADALRPNWIGQGANEFYDEMDSSILPALSSTRSATSFTWARRMARPR